MKKSTGEALENYWQGKNIPTLCPPASTRNIEAFENCHGVKFPQDFLEYLQLSNGFAADGNYQDALGFYFWGLDKICAVSEYKGGRFGFENADSYFIFCDYLDFSIAYASRLSGMKKGEIVVIGTASQVPVVVAQSFAEFVDLYIRHSDELLPFEA